MSQASNDYLWEFIQCLTNLYVFATYNCDQSSDGMFFDKMQSLSDFIYGYEVSPETNGIIFGFRCLPHSYTVFECQNYDAHAECLNVEVQSSKLGLPVITHGMACINGNIYNPFVSQGLDGIISNIDNSDADQSETNYLVPPANIKGAILTSTAYLSGTQIIHKFLKHSNQYYIMENDVSSTQLNIPKYIRNADNSSYFPQIGGNIVPIANIVWRIEDTTDASANNYKLSYHIIDKRRFYGYYGLKQPEELSILSTIYSQIRFSDVENMVELVGDIFSYLFKRVTWEYTDEQHVVHVVTFKAYWEHFEKTIDGTVLGSIFIKYGS